MKEELLFFKNHLCIPSRLRGQILKEAHKSPLAAHPGYQKMFASQREILLVKNKERCIGILQTMSSMPESQGKES